MDVRTRKNLEGVYADTAKKALWIIEHFKQYYGRDLSVTEGHRSYERQQELYNIGRIKKGRIVTHARPGYSFHQFGLALDFCFKGVDPYLKNDRQEAYLWDAFGDVAKSQGFVWGGDWRESRRDRPHIHMTYGFTLRQLRIFYGDGGMRRVFKRISVRLNA